MRSSQRILIGTGFIAASSWLFAGVSLSVASVAISQSPSGSRLEFEAASVRENNSDQQEPASLPLSADDSYPSAATLFHADFTLDTYIAFAYKIWETPNLRHDLLAGQPRWVGEQRYRIQARVPKNVTKDQIRLMMQSLLADRFGLRVHFESRDTPVLALTLAKADVLGPKLRRHEDGPACSRAETPTGDVFPLVCGGTEMKSDGPLAVVGARNVTLDKLASFLGTYGALNEEFAREVVDRTGLQGYYDYTVEFARKSLRDNPDTDRSVAHRGAARSARHETDPREGCLAAAGHRPRRATFSQLSLT
jgi:uncharacterized protein (TIGR03435 family)